MERLIDREKEMETLQSEYERKGSSLVIYPNMSSVESGNSRIVLDKIRKGLVTNHTAFVYEDVCWEKMLEMTDHHHDRSSFLHKH